MGGLYMNNIILNYGNGFSRKHPKYFELADQCFELANSIDHNLENKEIKRAEENILKFCLWHNFCKSTYSLISVVKLIDRDTLFKPRTSAFSFIIFFIIVVGLC